MVPSNPALRSSAAALNPAIDAPATMISCTERNGP
jgi:hypothetical protein